MQRVLKSIFQQQDNRKDPTWNSKTGNQESFSWKFLLNVELSNFEKVIPTSSIYHIL